MPNNEDRALRAKTALTAYTQGEEHLMSDSEALGDLLCDLRHLADTLDDVDYEESNTTGFMNYLAEISGFDQY